MKPINPAAPSPVAGGGSHAARPSNDEYDYAAKRAKEDSAKAFSSPSKKKHLEAAESHRIAASKADSKERAYHADMRARHEKYAADIGSGAIDLKKWAKGGVKSMPKNTDGMKTGKK